jgi:UDP-2,3-diacylglucosamine hydrolase
LKSPDTPIPTLIAPSDWGVIDFLSDLHLSPTTPQTLAALARHLEHTPAQAVFLLGDIFETWIGDDTRFTGFEAQCLALLQRASRIRQLFFMAGNRDFLLGEAMAKDAGLQRLQDPTCLEAHGQRLLLSHGDALCLDDQDYQRFRTQVRSADWQREFLARPLAARRAIAQQIREVSEMNQHPQNPQAWSDLDACASREWLQQGRCQILLHGHTHRPAIHQLGDGLSRWVLSDWDLEAATPRADVLRLDAQGLRRIAVN